MEGACYLARPGFFKGFLDMGSRRLYRTDRGSVECFEEFLYQAVVFLRLESKRIFHNRIFFLFKRKDSDFCWILQLFLAIGLYS